MNESDRDELKKLQCLVRGEEVVTTKKKLTRVAIEAFIVGLGPPISFCHSHFTNDIIFMNKLVPSGKRYIII